MSNDGKHFHSDSLQHVLNGAYDKNNRNLRITVAPDPPFRPSDILANVNPLEIDASLFPLPSNPYPIAVLSVVDNDVNDSFEWSIVKSDDDKYSTYFKLLKNPSDPNRPILAVSDEVEREIAGTFLRVRIRVCDSFGLCFEKTLIVNIVAAASVAGPTDIKLTDTNVVDNSVAGSYVAQLSTIGGVAGYTYSIVDDPDSKFSISGDVLQLAGSVDRNKAIRHNVTIKVTDANLVSFTKRITISIIPLIDDDTALAPLVNVSLYNSPSLTAFQKMTFSLQEGVKKLIIKVKPQTHISIISYSFDEYDYDNNNTHTISEGQTLVLDNLYLKGKEIFFSTNKDNSVVEIQQWF